MGIFGFGRKTKKPYKPRKRLTDDEKASQIATRELEHLSGDDKIGADIRAQLLEKHHGIKVRQSNRAQEIEQGVKDAVYESLENDIKGGVSNLVSQERKEELLDKILGSDFSQVHRGGPGEYFGGEPDPNTPEDIIERYNAMKEAFGGGGGGAFGFLGQPGVVLELLRTLQRFTGGGVLPADGGGQTYIVEVDGKQVPMSTEAYEVYLDQKRKLQLLSGDKIPEEVTAESAETDADPLEETITPSVSSNKDEPPTIILGEQGPVNVDDYLVFARTVSEAMKGTPKRFAGDLAKGASEGNEDSSSLLVFLTLTTYDKIMEMVNPYKDNEELIDFIQKLIDNREWVEEALVEIQRLNR